VSRESVSDTAPPPVTGALLAVGHQRFVIFCAPCHGPAGFGGGIVAANMRGGRRPPPLRTPRVRAMSADSVLGIVTSGRGLMPSYAWALSARERWAVVAYVAALQGVVTTEDTAAVNDSVRAASLVRGMP
jgi:mono/diheme cytochrome c family protein